MCINFQYTKFACCIFMFVTAFLSPNYISFCRLVLFYIWESKSFLAFSEHFAVFNVYNHGSFHSWQILFSRNDLCLQSYVDVSRMWSSEINLRQCPVLKSCTESCEVNNFTLGNRKSLKSIALGNKNICHMIPQRLHTLTLIWMILQSFVRFGSPWVKKTEVENWKV